MGPRTSNPLSTSMREAADRLADGSVSLVEILGHLRHGATGTLLVLLSIPAILPTPGIPAGMVFGSCMVVVALRMLVGAGPVALPARFAAVRTRSQLAGWMLLRGSRLVARIERVTRPRLAPLTGPGMRPLLALAVLAMGVIIALPIPYANHLPGLAVMAIGAGLAGDDGLAVLAGLALAGLSVAATAGLVWIGYDVLAWLFG